MGYRRQSYEIHHRSLEVAWGRSLG